MGEGGGGGGGGGGGAAFSLNCVVLNNPTRTWCSRLSCHLNAAR